MSGVIDNKLNRKIDIKVSDGTSMNAYVARPIGPKANGKVPGVIVLQEAFGVRAHIRDIADKLAFQGYVALAPELFHRTAPVGYEGPYDDFSAIMPHLQAVTTETLTKDIGACFEWLNEQSDVDSGRIGIIGFCLGGRASFLANGIFPLKAAVSYYGGRIAPDYLPYAEKQAGPIMMVWGGKDKHIGPDQQRAVADALRHAGKPFVDVEFSEADHGFLCHEKKSFHPVAAKQAWALTLAFLKAI